MEEVMQVLRKLNLLVLNFLSRDEGQDLVEYSLVIALVAFGSIAGMGYLATGLNNAFSSVSSTLTTNV
jgi:pilus assembly protein Flp/PilA